MTGPDKRSFSITAFLTKSVVKRGGIFLKDSGIAPETMIVQDTAICLLRIP
jgi:hypothetical protein